MLECLKCHFKCGPKGEETHLRDSISSDLPANLETALKKEQKNGSLMTTESMSSLSS